VDRCIVCNTQINKKKAYLTLRFKGEDYSACCPLCESEFEKEPEKYAGDKDNIANRNTARNHRKVRRNMAKDPVCGMQVDENKAAASVDFEGKTYHFCSTACKEKFEESPHRYIDEEKQT
jgi:Cu+-exporting ATPase